MPIADRVLGSGPGSAPRIAVELMIECARRAEEAREWDDAEGLYKEALKRIDAGQCVELGPRVMRWLGRVHLERGEWERAEGLLQASLIAARKLNRRNDVGSAFNSLGVIAQLRGALDVAQALYTRAGEVAEEIGDHQLAAIVDQNLGVLAQNQGDAHTALQRYHSALNRFNHLDAAPDAAKAARRISVLSADFRYERQAS